MNNRRLCFLVIFVMLVSLSGCCNAPPEAPCPIEGLLLGETDLPGNDWVGEIPSSLGAPKRLGGERIGNVFSAPGLFDALIHHIYRLEDEKSAYRAYVDIEEEDFQLRDYLNEWELPLQLSQLQLSANYQKIGCNKYKDSGAEECRLLAQYGPYLVQFRIRQHGLQYTDVVQLIQEIDSRMTECLSQK